MPLPAIPPEDGYHHLTLPDGSADCRFRYQPRISETVDVPIQLLHFDGREYPVAYFGEGTDETHELDFMIDTEQDGDQWTNLRALLDGASRGSVLVWTDQFGAQISCVLRTPSRELLVGRSPGRFQHVRFRLERVEEPV